MAEWKSTGHLFLALDKCGTSALWLHRQIKNEEFLAMFTEALESNRKYPRDAADDFEVALFFSIWPDQRPVILSAIRAVGEIFRSTRVLTLRSLMLRKNGVDGKPIQDRMDLCRSDRREASEDAAEALWLTDPGLAIGLSRRAVGPTSALDAYLLRSQEEAKKQLGTNLMEGLE